MPLPFFLLIGVFGLILLWGTHRYKWAATFLTLSLLGIFLSAFQPVATHLLAPLENQYKGYIANPAKPIRYVMVLGSGHIINPDIPITSELSRTALMRMAEGIRIHRLWPTSKLIFSGYDGGTSISQARITAQVAIALGVSKSDIILLETPKDTEQEAQQAAKLLKGDSQGLVLVTSASHMPRAMTYFHNVGLNPIPAPTNFMAVSGISEPWQKYTPKAQYLEETQLFWHEQLGTWWQQLKDKR